MNAINRAVTSLFDVILTPLEAVGDEFALLVVSGVFGVLALWVFKYISWQKGIKATKDKIKGHLIEIRLYQDDLVLVTKAIGKVLFKNLQYLTLNFAPFVPLAFPFAFVVAQMVVRYGFEPVPVQHVAQFDRVGEGVTLKIDGTREALDGIELVLPDGLTATGPFAVIPRHGNATQHFVPEAPGVYDIVIRTGGQEVEKQIVVGTESEVRSMQPNRVRSPWLALLWPAEDTLAGTGLESIEFAYPESDLGWLPLSGPIGVIIVFVVASMLVGFAALKPLGVQI